MNNRSYSDITVYLSKFFLGSKKLWKGWRRQVQKMAITSYPYMVEPNGMFY